MPNRCRTAEEQQEVAVQFIRDNALRGYLAYQDGKVVGWCNANTRSECYGCISWQFLMKEVRLDECKVKSVFCFEIAPEFRGKGIAARLLERVCRDARQEGFDYVEAYPNAEFTDEQKDFMGPVKMYEKQGFRISYQMGNKLVMRKQIKERST